MITQDEFDQDLIPNPTVTMALPLLAPLLVPKIPEKKMLQKTLWGLFGPPKPTTKPKAKVIKVGKHMRGTKQVKAHLREITGDKNKSKTKRANEMRMSKKKEDCKESVKLAKSLYIQEFENYNKKTK
jgi:hypothetical protein